MRQFKTADDMKRLFGEVSNWGKWGKDDERGTLNYLTPSRIADAARLVKRGRQVSCARDFPTEPGPHNHYPALHFMVVSGDDPCAAGVHGLELTADFIGIAYHGFACSHIDALCHNAVEGKMYNDVPLGSVLSTGARRNSITAATRHGIAGRGVLLDIPRLRGGFVAYDKPVTVDELEAAEKKQNVRVGEGDILLISVGRDAMHRHSPPTHENFSMGGLDPNCIPWFHERKIAALGSDAVHDPQPPRSTADGWPIPVHMCGIVGMGMHLLDNLYLADLEQLCAELSTWEFMFTVAPLRIEKGTGSPINPIALF